MATPFTVPELLIVATAGLLLLQVPLAVVLLKTIADPTQTDEGPLIADGRGCTVMVIVAAHAPTGKV